MCPAGRLSSAQEELAGTEEGVAALAAEPVAAAAAPAEGVAGRLAETSTQVAPGGKQCSQVRQANRALRAPTRVVLRWTVCGGPERT